MSFVGSTASSTGAIAGGVAAGAALLFAAPAILFAWWRRRKPQEHFFDVPGWYKELNVFLIGSFMILKVLLYSVQLKRTQKSTWGSSKDFLFENCKLQLIILATKTFLEEEDLVKYIRDDLQMVHW